MHSYILLNTRKSKSVSTHYTHLVRGSHQDSVSVAGKVNVETKEYDTRVQQFLYFKTRTLIPAPCPYVWHLVAMIGCEKTHRNLDLDTKKESNAVIV